jgi:hypothetical protein
MTIRRRGKFANKQSLKPLKDVAPEILGIRDDASEMVGPPILDLVDAITDLESLRSPSDLFDELGIELLVG